MMATSSHCSFVVISSSLAAALLWLYSLEVELQLCYLKTGMWYLIEVLREAMKWCARLRECSSMPFIRNFQRGHAVETVSYTCIVRVLLDQRLP